MLSANFERRLAVPDRAAIREHWEKARDRLEADAEGAITSARSMLESACLHALNVLGSPGSEKSDLPKLFHDTAVGLGMATSQQTLDINKRLFGAVHTIVQSVGELRNKAGDSHGRSGAAVRSSRGQAELAVFSAASVTNFLLANIDSYIATRHRRTSDGGGIYKFDKATVWRLLDHARNSPEHHLSFGEDKEGAGLWFVGDAGVYLMSNGKPPQLADGTIARDGTAMRQRRLVSYAEGCGPNDDFEDSWAIHNAFAGGSDFSETIPISEIEPVLEASRDYLIIVGSEDGYYVYSDTDFRPEDH